MTTCHRRWMAASLWLPLVMVFATAACDPDRDQPDRPGRASEATNNGTAESTSSSTTAAPVLDKSTRIDIHGVGPMTIGSAERHVVDVGGGVETLGGDLDVGYGCMWRGFERPELDDLSYMIDAERTVVAIYVAARSTRSTSIGLRVGDEASKVFALDRTRYRVETEHMAFQDAQELITVADAQENDPRSVLGAVAVDGKIDYFVVGRPSWVALEPHVQVENCRPE